MRKEQAIQTRAHLEVVKCRLQSLKSGLEAAVRNKDEIDRERENWELRRNAIKIDNSQRKVEIETGYNNDIQEYKNQNKLCEEILEEKRKERKTLLDYLNTLDFCDFLPLDPNAFNWETLNKISMGSKRADHVEDQKRKLAELVGLNQLARTRFNTMVEVYTSTLAAKNRVRYKLNELKRYIHIWKETDEILDKKISKLRNENDRLNLIIKQCVPINACPLSDNIVKNIRLMCQSFLNTKDPNELYNGLLTFRDRQEKAIAGLKQKVNQLTRDTNHLQVAKDQTADHMSYYVNIIQANKEIYMQLPK